MIFFKLLIGHPYFWTGIFLLFYIFFYFKGKKTKMYLTMFLSIFFASLCTPIISFWGLESLKYLMPKSDSQCENSVAKAAILLPGGLYFSDGEYKLNVTSLRRADLIVKLSESDSVTSVIIPGGYLNEGALLKSYLSEGLELDLYVGVGSSNTVGNFEEISGVLVKGQYYWLVTSYWHYVRSSLVASKLGIKLCPVLTKSARPSYWLYHKDAHWNGKAFIHEYMGIIYYWISGDI